MPTFTTEIGDWFVINQFTVPDHTTIRTVRIEPGVGGRLLYVTDADEEDVTAGRITTWDPPRGLAFVDSRDLEVTVTSRLSPEAAAWPSRKWASTSSAPRPPSECDATAGTGTCPNGSRSTSPEGAVPDDHPKLGNLVPYLFYTDIEAMVDWYSRVFGFVEKERWRGRDGNVHNAEMVVGDTELWMDSVPNKGPHKLSDAQGNPLPVWAGVWLETAKRLMRCTTTSLPRGSTPPIGPTIGPSASGRST